MNFYARQACDGVAVDEAMIFNAALTIDDVAELRQYYTESQTPIRN